MANIMEWERVFPIHAIEENLLIGGNGEITIGFNLLLPEIYTLSVDDHNQANTEYIKLFNILPAHTTLHKQDFFFEHTYKDTSHVTGIVEQENIRHLNGRPILIHYSNLYITFKQTANIKSSSDTSFIKALGGTSGKKNKEQQEFLKTVTPIIDNLNSYLTNTKFIKAKRMNADQLGSALYDYFSVNYKKPSTDYSEKILPPLDCGKDLQIGNQYIKIISLLKEADKVFSCAPNKGVLPKNPALKINPNISMQTSYVYPIGIGLPIDHILNTIITIKDKDELAREMEMDKRNINVVKTFSTEAKFKHTSLEEYQDTIAGHGYVPVIMSMNVILNHHNLDYLNDSISLVNTGFTTIGAKGWTENYDTANLFFASAPGNAFNNYRSLLTIADLAVCYLHKETHYYADQKGLVFVDRFGNPCVVDLWDSKYIVNKNILVIGPSGSGKSFFTNNVVNQDLYLNHHIIIIDIGHSYKRNCEINNGKYFDSSDLKNLSFNPFLYAEKDNEGNYIYQSTDDESKDDIINTIYTLVVTIWKGKESISQESKSILKDLIKKFFEYVNKNRIFPNLIEFDKYITIYQNDPSNESYKRYFDFNSLSLLLQPYTVGEYKFLLNANENIDVINDKFIVFDLEAVGNNPDVFNILSVIIIELTLQKCNKLPGIKKTLIIDEGLNFLEDEKMGEYIGHLFRTIRKKEGQIALATQNVNFLKNIPPIIRDSIIINTDIKILLDHTNYKSSYKDIQEILSFTDKDIELLDSIQNGKGYREFMIKLGNKSFIYRNEVSEFAAGVYTSKQSEVIEIEKRFEKTGSLTAAIKQYIEDKSKNNN